MKKALRPVCRRIRAQRALTAFCLGLAAGLILALLWRALSFLTPLRALAAGLLACAALPPLCALLAGLWPVSPLRAARAADGCGLRERAQTALMLRDRQDEMAVLQKADALRALKALNVRRALPLRAPRAALTVSGLCAAALLASFFLPNPQQDTLRAQDRFLQKMEQPARAVEQAGEKIQSEHPDDRTARELRRMTDELARRLRGSRDSREALSALSDAARQMEKLSAENRGAAADALSGAGLGALEQAVRQEDAQAVGQAMQSAAENAAQLADQLRQAAEAAQAAGNSAAASALQKAAESAAQGDAAQAAQALNQLSAESLSSGALAAAIQGAKAIAGGQGQSTDQSQAPGQGQGGGSGKQPGQGAGAGAGKGSTNQDAGAGQGGSQGGAGADAAAYKLGQYESIYDPTRLGDGGEISQSTGKVDENAQISEMTLGPGQGSLAGQVPYNQVVGDYQAAAVQRAQEAALPGYAQQWVADYFSALTE